LHDSPSGMASGLHPELISVQLTSRVPNFVSSNITENYAVCDICHIITFLHRR